MKYLFYPGCNAEQVEKEALIATEKVCERLGIELEYAADFSCCGATHVDKVDSFLNLLINARNMIKAEKKHLPIMTICNTCYIVLKRVQKELEDETIRSKVNTELSKVGLKYYGTAKILHFIDVIHEYGIENLKAEVHEPLMQKVAPFYGCHYLRPEKDTGQEELEAEQKVDDIIEAVGAELVNYERESSCCGFHVTMANPELCAKMNGKNLLSAKAEEAELLVTPCTLCHTVMDGQQHRAEKAVGEKIQLPVLHLPQIIGLAMGMSEKELGINRHVVPFKRVMSYDDTTDHDAYEESTAPEYDNPEGSTED